MRQWANSWIKGKPKQRAILLHGPAGTGKTTAAIALGAEMGWDVLEVNASDKRSQSALDEVIRSSQTRYSLLTGRSLKLIILDEVDGLSGTGDRGGVRAISDLVRKSVNPVVLTANDLYSQKLRSLRRGVQAVEFGKTPKMAVQAALREICRKEGVEANLLAINLLAERADGDLRSAINDLEALSVNGSISREDLRVPEKRKTDADIYQVLDLIFDGDPDSTRQARELNMEPRMVLEWVSENIPVRLGDAFDRARAYEMAASADICLARVYRRMHWGFWGYATDLMTKGVGSMAGTGPLAHYGRRFRYSYPRDYLRHRMGMRSRGSGSLGAAREDEKAAVGKMGSRCHMSSREVREEFLPYLRVINENNPDKADAMLRWFGLTDEQICSLRLT
jgi:replication factor C large subunit